MGSSAEHMDGKSEIIVILFSSYITYRTVKIQVNVGVSSPRDLLIKTEENNGPVFIKCYFINLFYFLRNVGACFLSSATPETEDVLSLTRGCVVERVKEAARK